MSHSKNNLIPVCSTQSVPTTWTSDTIVNLKYVPLNIPTN